MTAQQARERAEQWFATEHLDSSDEPLGSPPNDFVVKVWPASRGRWAFAARWTDSNEVAERGHVLASGVIATETIGAELTRELAVERAKARQAARRAA